MTHTLADLLPSLLASLGVSTEPNPLAIAPSEGREAVLLVDGLGSDHLIEYAAYAPRMASMVSHLPFAAPFPSTTATSLASLGTGVLPHLHGMFGYSVRVPDSGTPPRILNALKWDERVDPITWQPHSTAFERGAAAGVRVVSISARHYQGSGFTQAALRGTEYFGVSKSAPMLHHIPVAMSAPRTLAYLYVNELDAAGHAKGVGSFEWLEALTRIDQLVDALLAELPGGTRLWVTGDHGMINADERIDMGTLPADGIEAFAGEGRARHVYTVAGACADVAVAWGEHLAGRVDVVARDEAIAAGWFGGAVESRFAQRIGDLLAIPRGKAVLIDPARSKEGEMIGHHGGRSPAEIGVPLRVAHAERP
jgi:hypothetical protein